MCVGSFAGSCMACWLIISMGNAVLYVNSPQFKQDIIKKSRQQEIELLESFITEETDPYMKAMMQKGLEDLKMRPLPTSLKY